MRSLDYYIVENLRSARRFLASLPLGRPIDELHFGELNEHTAPQEVERLIAPLLEGHDVGLLSEAGVPAVADPGSEVVALCHKKGIRVIPLVGPSSAIMALMASGANGQSFAFNGYLPVKQAERIKAIRHFESRAVRERQSQIFIEAPYRNEKLLADLLATCSPETRLCIAADITAPNEFILTKSITQWRKMSPHPAINRRPAIFILT